MHPRLASDSQYRWDDVELATLWRPPPNFGIIGALHSLYTARNRTQGFPHPRISACVHNHKDALPGLHLAQQQGQAWLHPCSHPVWASPARAHWLVTNEKNDWVLFRAKSHPILTRAASHEETDSPPVPHPPFHIAEAEGFIFGLWSLVDSLLLTIYSLGSKPQKQQDKHKRCYSCRSMRGVRNWNLIILSLHESLLNSVFLEIKFTLT